MADVPVFDPLAVYAPDPGDGELRVLIAPPKYIQGAGALSHVGRYMSTMGPVRSAVLASARGHSAQAGQVITSLGAQGVESVAAIFAGECSLAEIEEHVTALREAQVDCLVAVGGGKCVDAGKCIAYRLGIPVVIVPTLASNDAPCSALSVLYTPDGVMNGAEFFPDNPALVVVDTQVVADADERFLVAGLGDAMATWYEARVCAQNPAGRTLLGTRPTIAACALGEACAHTLYADALDACAAVRACRVDDALERIVEANTLLSGIGFESGGLAGAHGYAQGYTVLPEVEHNYLHGEMVGMGNIAQLMLEQNPDEACRVAEFFARVGLPIHLEQLGVDRGDTGKVRAVAEGASSFAPFANLGIEINREVLADAMLSADLIGRSVAERLGDQAYRRLHG